jgi:hypothetical protein
MLAQHDGSSFGLPNTTIVVSAETPFSHALFDPVPHAAAPQPLVPRDLGSVAAIVAKEGTSDPAFLNE